MKWLARTFVVAVIALDVVFVAAVVTGAPLSVGTVMAQSTTADTSGAEETDAPAPPEAPSAESLRLLGRELVERQAELEQRELEIRELIRGNEVLRRAGLLPEEEEQADPAAPDAEESEQRIQGRMAFRSLQRAYENMEPESAASALAQLAERDKQAVIELLLGWSPRVSGAILDALTQTNPALSADLSYEIWKLGADSETTTRGT